MSGQRFNRRGNLQPNKLNDYLLVSPDVKVDIKIHIDIKVEMEI